MEVHFTPEQEAQLSQIATTVGTNAEQLVKEPHCVCFRKTSAFAQPCGGARAADRGEFIEEADMDARVEQMLRS